MSVTEAPRLIPPNEPGRLTPGTVLVADELLSRGRAIIGCPAAVLIPDIEGSTRTVEARG
jgi:hypothetical protein